MIIPKTAVLGTCTLGLAVALSGCQIDNYPTTWDNGTPVHAQPYQTWWSYQFMYYPGQQVYFEPYTEQYFWFDNGLWEEGAELPEQITLDPKRVRVVKVQHRKPYIQHQTVTTWHPNVYKAAPGSLDPYHATPDAIAMSEQRAAIRLASTIDEIDEMAAEFGGMTGDMRDMSGSVIITNETVRQSASAGTSSPMDMNPDGDMSSEQHDDMISGVDTTNDDTP